MTPNRILAALVEARGLLRSEGNPNHDDQGRFATAPGHGKHHAKRQRRKKRLAKRVKAIRADRAEMKARHKAERQDRVKTERAERKDLRREHHAEHKSLGRDQARERKELDRDHARELRREKDPDERASLVESHGLNQKEQASSHRQERKDLRAAHKEARADQATEHRDERQNVKEGHRDERREWVEGVKDELREEFPHRKGKSDASRSASPDHVFRAVVDRRRFAVGRTHKASSAEAILRHCLRQRGWTGAYARGQLTGRQRLRLLEDIRRYARAWLRHEAEAFMRQYGRVNDESTEEKLSSRAVQAKTNTSRESGAFDQNEWQGIPGIGSTLESDDRIIRGLTGAIARHVGRFFQRAKSFVHEVILAGSLAFFSPADDMTEDDMRHVDHEAQTQARYFDRFHQEVVSAPPLEIAEPTPIPAIAPMTAKQFVARAEQYGDAPWGAAQEVNRKRLIRGGEYVEERRIHGKMLDDMCEVCSKAVADGWQPIGTLPRIGDSPCLGNCHCFFQYADKDGNRATTVRKMRRKKKVA